MLLLKSGAKFYALTWKDLQDILLWGKKKLQNVGEHLTSFVSLSTHTYTDTQTCAQTDVRTHRHTHTHTHTPVIMHILKMKKLRDFPGGSVVKSPRF